MLGLRKVLVIKISDPLGVNKLSTQGVAISIDQSVDEFPTPSYSMLIGAVKEGTKSPVVQIPALTATEDLLCPVDPHST